MTQPITSNDNTEDIGDVLPNEDSVTAPKATPDATADIQPEQIPDKKEKKPQNIINEDNYRPPVNPRPAFEKALVSSGYNEAEVKQITLDEIIGLPSMQEKDVTDNLRNVPNLKLTPSEEAYRWQARGDQAYRYTTSDNMFDSTLTRGKWTNSMQHNNKSLATAYPKLPSKSGASISGEVAAIQLSSHLGMGTVCNTKLPSSGFYITFKPPSEDQIIEVNRLLITGKVRLGRETYGLVFSNYSVFTMQTLLNFALSNIYVSTIKFNKEDKTQSSSYLDYIRIQDYPIIINGLAASIYPRGLMYESPCMVDPTKCLHVTSDTIVMTKMQHDDEDGMTEWHKTFLLDRSPQCKTVAEILQYQNTLTSLSDKEVELISTEGTSVFITLKSPTVGNAITYGTNWVNNCVAAVEANAGLDMDEKTKNSLFIQQASASEMNHYLHFVKAVRWGDFAELTSVEDISMMLGRLSQDDSIRESFVKEVRNYINNSTISVIGVPVYKCPACEQTPKSPDGLRSALKEIIPLDVPSLFFDLLSHRLKRILRR